MEADLHLRQGPNSTVKQWKGLAGGPGPLGEELRYLALELPPWRGAQGYLVVAVRRCIPSQNGT